MVWETALSPHPNEQTVVTQGLPMKNVKNVHVAGRHVTTAPCVAMCPHVITANLKVSRLSPLAIQISSNRIIYTIIKIVKELCICYVSFIFERGIVTKYLTSCDAFSM